MKTYGDLFKKADDFFKKTFSFGHTVEASGKTDIGLGVTGEGKISDSKFSGTLKASGYKHGAFSLDKIEFATGGTIKVESSLSDVAPGTSLSFKGADGTRASEAKTSAVVGVKSVHDAFTVDCEVDVVNGPSVNVASTFGFRDAVIGADVGLSAKDFKITKHDVAVAYAHGNTTVGAKVTNKFAKATAYAHHAQGKSTFAGRATFATGFGSGDAASGVDVAFGIKYGLGADSTIAGAVNHKGIVDAAYTAKVCDHAKLTVSAKVDALNIGRDVHQVGTKFSVSA